MRNISSFILILFLGSACAGPPALDKASIAYDPAPDIDRYLATEDPAEESEILKRLTESKVSHDTIKSHLRVRAIGQGGPTGLFLGVPVKHMGKELTYSLYVPDSARDGKQLPMIVLLHGMGGRGDSTLQRWRKRLNDEFIILCPSYPMGAWWTLSAEELVLQLILETKMRVPVDPNRIFLAGLSNGALGTYMIGTFYPDYFAGVIPIAGAISEPHYLHFLINLTNTPVYSIQGQYDPIFPIQFSYRINKILNDMKYPLTYREHTEKGSAHGGHFMPESEVPPLLEWLKEQQRESISERHTHGPGGQSSGSHSMGPRDSWIEYGCSADTRPSAGIHERQRRQSRHIDRCSQRTQSVRDHGKKPTANGTLSGRGPGEL